jgi:hypothetical protein
VHWAEALIAGTVGALAFGVSRVRRLLDSVVVYVPFYMVARGWWRQDARPWLAACAALSVILVLPRLRRESMPRPVLWSVLGIVVASLVGGFIELAVGVDPTPVFQAAAVAGAGFAAYAAAVAMDAGARGRLSRVCAVGLVVLMMATAWHARSVVRALRHGASPSALARARILDDRLRVPGVGQALGRAEVLSWLERGAVATADSVAQDLVRRHPDEPGMAVLRARILERRNDSGALVWLAAAAHGALGAQDLKYVARRLRGAGWVGPWADGWDSMRAAEEELFADSCYAFRLAVALRLRGRHGDALELLGRLQGGVPESWRAYEIGRIASDRGDEIEARAWYARSSCEQDNPPDAPLRLRQGGDVSAVGAALGGVTRLISSDVVPTTVVAGGGVRVVLEFQVLDFPPDDYRVFLHFEESLHPQHRFYGDHDPQGGTRASTSWLPGEVISDTSWVGVPSKAAPGTYRVWAGLFVPLGTKPRLGVPGHDKVDVGRIEVTNRPPESGDARSTPVGL